MKKHILCFSVVLSTFLLLCGCGDEPEPEPESNAVPVEIQTVSKSAISAENNVSGQVTSGKEESVFVAVSARCTDVYVEVGDTVSAGQTICTLDISSTWANYETASMSYENARKSYEDQSSILSQQVAQAEKNVTDTQALFDLGAASQVELDNAKLALENARAGMTSALSQLEIGMQNYKATMEQLKSTLSNIDRNGNVTAPISGTILSLSAAKSSFVSPNAPVVTVDSTTNMEISVGVSESLIPKLKPGGRADVSIESADRYFQGTIATIDASANPTNHLYGVTIKVPASSASGLLSGMFADVTFFTDTQNNVVVIPTEAIQTGLDGQYVYTIDPNNIAHKVSVETGLVGDGVTEISKGLSGGEKLVTVGQFYLSDGAEVRVVSPEV